MWPCKLLKWSFLGDKNGHVRNYPHITNLLYRGHPLQFNTCTENYRISTLTNINMKFQCKVRLTHTFNLFKCLLSSVLKVTDVPVT